MCLRLVTLVIGAVACRVSPTSSTEPTEPVDAGEAAPADAEDQPLDEEDVALDFGEDVADPSSSVAAQPERPPVGSFELCGDKCRDNVDLERSMDAGTEN